ncbi:uncharacterized protein DS421_19g654440 [Arachis hypogaea]|uniref:Uncharacterized protein n=1 Tax=Arachis hypogaea TaxID=3818 RepID=A0A6B9VBQ7_ARAHY|nr:uncharacterized protein DS421_19g654440 [Arachis hypogaea]
MLHRRLPSANQLEEVSILPEIDIPSGFPQTPIRVFFMVLKASSLLVITFPTRFKQSALNSCCAVFCKEIVFPSMDSRPKFSIRPE